MNAPHRLFSLTLVASLAFAVAPTWADDESNDDENKLQYLVPEMEGQSFRVDPGKRPYLRRLSFSPAYGQFGSSDYYTFRLGYNPNSWLGYEANLGHNPSNSVHALVNTLHATLRVPLPGRFQPYVSGGYGMMFIFPGKTFKADPVTRNVMSGGAGLEIFIRNDVALRGEIRGTSLLGGGSDSGESLSYREFTVGLSFYRTLSE